MNTLLNSMPTDLGNTQPLNENVNPLGNENLQPKPQSLLLTLFPTFRLYTAEEMKNMSAEQIGGVLQSVNSVRETLHSNVIKLETQAVSLDGQIKEIHESIKKEFQVESLEELQTHQTHLLSLIEDQFTKLANITTSAA